MKKRFLPFGLLLVIMILGQSVMADEGGHYVPRTQENESAEAFIASMRVNQFTGLIDPAWMIKSAQQSQTAVSSKDEEVPVYWVSMGPDNFGGRTTCIVYNNANPNEVYVGSMGGGVFYTWNQGVTWHQVGENLMVSCMAQAEDGTIYVGTGDGNGTTATTYNQMTDLGVNNSFVGSGLYTIKNNVMELVPSTRPSTQNDIVEWSYINAIAIDGNTVIIAGSDGLRYSTDGCATWNYALCDGEELTNRADEVFVASDHSIIASVKGNLYIGSLDNMVCHSSKNDTYDNGTLVSIAESAYIMDIAVSPTDPKVIYAANFTVNGQHNNVYVTQDKGATWHIALPTVYDTYGHLIYGGRALFNHGLVVDPDNTDWVYVCGYDLWRLERTASDPNGFYIATKLSDGNSTSLYDPDHMYLHVGVNDIAFDPRDAKNAYVATDGGIFKAVNTIGNDYLAFSNCNRGYVSTRSLSVGVSGKAERIITGLLDHGPVLIEGDANADHMTTGVTLLPNSDPSSFGLFDESYHAGTCAVSAINPAVFIFAAKNGNFKRTETAGADYDISNFTGQGGQPSFSGYTGFRMPFVLFENFEDQNNRDSVWYFGKDGDHAGDLVQCFSNNGKYPFNVALPCDMTSHDSVQLQDPISAKLYVGLNNNLYVTRDPLHFDRVTKYYKIADRKAGFNGTPTTLAVSNDGDVLFAGMKTGRFVRVSNLNTAVDENTSTMTSDDFAIETVTIDLPTDRQVITSIAIDPNDANKVVVTLGNYGNEQYVLFSQNALADEPTFVSVQGNLPLMPVYSSVVVMQNGYVMVGTECGVWMTKDITASEVEWFPAQDNMGNVPVIELKQQTLYHAPQYVDTYVDTLVVTVEVPGVSNQGIIYASTYGRGVFRCENYRMTSGASVVEIEDAVKSLNMYPNPVRNKAMVSFDLKENATVNYQVFDMMGRMVKNENLGKLENGSHEAEVSVEGLATGAYVLRLNAGSNTSTVKFLVY